MIEQAFRGKTKKCPKGCDVDIYFESRYDSDLKQVITKDGKKPDGSNTRWWMMEDLTKTEHLNCRHYDLE